MKRIFIGGTGRSGTTILQHVLSFHEQLYTIPIETKFIVQSDGLYSLVQHLTHDFSITDASIGIARFKTLMHDVITHTGVNPYADLAGQPYGRLEFLPQEIFPDYWQTLDTFFGQINSKYYKREYLIKLAGGLVDGLFGVNAANRHADGWVEKTPSNLFRIEFLFEMFPDAIFINCVRDPRGVLDSFMRKEWITGSLEEGAAYLVPYYEYVAGKRQFGMAQTGQYYEIRLEELVANPVDEFGKLLDFIQMRPFSEERNEFLSKILREGSIHWIPEQGKYCDSWELNYTQQEKDSISGVLADIIKDYGYKL